MGLVSWCYGGASAFGVEAPEEAPDGALELRWGYGTDTRWALPGLEEGLAVVGVLTNPDENCSGESEDVADHGDLLTFLS